MNALFQTTRMPPLPLPLATALAVALVLGWAALLMLRPEGVRVANHTPQVLRAVTVCGDNGACAFREHLRPHEAWTVPLRPARNACLDLSFAGQTGNERCTPVEPGEAVRLVVKSGGQVRAE